VAFAAGGRLVQALGLMRQVSVLEAKCASCGCLFSHPSLGDFAYGEALLCTADGKHYATVDISSDFVQRLNHLVKQSGASQLWPALASLADPVAGQSLTQSIRCPHCASDSLEYWGGQMTGTAMVPEATFLSASALSPSQLAKRIGVSASLGHEA